MADEIKGIKKKISGKANSSDNLFPFQESHPTHFAVKPENIYSYDKLPTDPYAGDPADNELLKDADNYPIGRFRDKATLTAIPNSVVPGTKRARAWKFPQRNIIRTDKDESYLPVLYHWNGSTRTELNPVTYQYEIDYEAGVIFIPNDSDILVNDYTGSERYELSCFYFLPNYKNHGNSHLMLEEGKIPLKQLSASMSEKYPWKVIADIDSAPPVGFQYDILYLIDPDGGAPTGAWSSFAAGDLVYCDGFTSDVDTDVWTKLPTLPQNNIFLNLATGLLWQYKYDNDAGQWIWKEFSLVSDVANKLIVSTKGGNYTSLQDAIDSLTLDGASMGVIDCFTDQNFTSGGGK